MCDECGCGSSGDFQSGDVGPRPSDGGVLFRVVEPSQCVPNYVVPGALDHSREVTTPAAFGGIADAALAGTDGRAATAGVPSMTPSEQAPYGWGFVRAAPDPGETPAGVLTTMLSDPLGYSARQQDAVRRDQGDGLVDYASYAPVPFAGADPLSGGYVGGFDPAVTEPGSLIGPRTVI